MAQGWKPPSYAVPVDDEENNVDNTDNVDNTEWQPPEYAQPVEASTVEEKSNILKRAWDTISEPLTEAPTRFAEEVSNYINPERTVKGVKGVGSAFLEGVGHAISGLTSPLNLAFAGAGEGATLAESALPKIAQALRTGTRVLSAPIAAEGAKHTYEGVKEHDFGKTLSGVLEAGMGALGLKEHVPGSAEEPPIRRPNDFISRSIEKPYRAGGSVVEPETYKIREETPIRQDDKLAKDPYEFAGDSIKQPEVSPREFSHSKLADKVAEEKPKEPFVNPFEKPKIEEPIIEKPTDKPVAKLGEDKEFKLATEKFNMGKDLSDNAEFLALNEQGQPMYNIVNEDGTRSTFTGSEELAKRGIRVPETPKDAIPMKGSEIREKYLKDKEELSKDTSTSHGPTNEYFNNQKYDLKYTGGDAQQAAKNTKAKAFRKLNSKSEWKAPDYAQPAEIVKKGDIALGEQKQSIIDTTDANKTPESLHPQLSSLKNYGDGVLYMDFDKTKPITIDDVKATLEKQGYKADVTEMYSNDKMPSRFRVDIIGDDPVHADELGNKIEHSVGGSFDKNDTVELSGGLGGIKPPKQPDEPFKGPAGPALDKLLSLLQEAKGKVGEQEAINKVERARRFAAFSGVKAEGAAGAAKSLGKLKGEFEKTEPGEGLGLSKEETDSLFTAIKRSNMMPGEKARGYTALFKLMNGERVVRSELSVLDQTFGNGFADKITEMYGGLGLVGMRINKVANTMKALMYSGDLSMGLRQGLSASLRPEWREAMVEQVKYFAKPEYFDAAQQAIKDHPKFPFARESGLFFAEPGGLSNGEEAFMDNYVGNIPKGVKGLGVRNLVDASERAYIGGLNKLRFDLFNNMTKLAENMGHTVSNTKDFVNTEDMKVINRLKKFAKENGISDDIENEDFIKLAKKNDLSQAVTTSTKTSEDIAKIINVFTGRGSLGKLERIKGVMNTVFGSPKMISSRLTALNPKFYVDLDPFARKEAIKFLLSTAAASTILNGLGAAMGAKVSLNILSSDFMKSRFPSGNVLDPGGSFQQPVVLAARMIAELNRMASGRKAAPGERNIPQLVGDFTANKLSPMTGLAYDLVSASKFTGSGNFVDRFGNKKNVLTEVQKRFVSIFSQDMWQLLQSDPSFAESVGLPPLMILGAGEQAYPEKKPSSLLQIRKPKLQ